MFLKLYLWGCVICYIRQQDKNVLNRIEKKTS